LNGDKGCFKQHLTDAWLCVLQEKVLNFVLRENAGGEHISKAALVQFLQHEYEVGVWHVSVVISEKSALA
jgi:hypothetical protein